MLDRVDQEQVLGFYDDRSKRLVVIRDAGVSRPLLELTLAHELVHALEDQRFGLDVGEGVRDDEVLAEAALAEGTATALMADYAGRAPRPRRTCCRSPTCRAGRGPAGVHRAPAAVSLPRRGGVRVGVAR